MSRVLAVGSRVVCAVRGGTSAMRTTAPQRERRALSTKSVGQELSRTRHQTLTLLQHPFAAATDVWLVGTAHVSAASAREVVDVMRMVRPRTVILELDASRAARLRTVKTSVFEDRASEVESWQTDMAARFRETAGALGGAGNMYARAHEEVASRLGMKLPPGVANDAFSNQEGFGPGMLGDVIRKFYNAFRAYGLFPGLEFKLAMEEAREMNAKVVYGDRDFRVTMDRIWNSMSMHELMGLLKGDGKVHVPTKLQELLNNNNTSATLEDIIEHMKDRETVLEITNILRTNLPGAAKALIDERDDHLVRSILAERQGPMVVVVGCAHVPGIEQRWNDPEFLHQSQKKLTN